MSVWVGVLGGMVETPCLSGLQVKREDRTVHGGGAGTLSAPRAVVWGAGHRVWSADLAVASPGELAGLEALVYRQQVQGGAYRMLACDAHHTNALTPAASLDFSGWTGARTVTATYSALVEVAGGGTMLYPSTMLTPEFMLEHGGSPYTVEATAAFTVTPATTPTVLASPIVPVVPGRQVTLGVFGRGAVTLAPQWTDALGASLGPAVGIATANHADLRRLTGSTVPPANAHGVRVVVHGGNLYAWPSITWTPGPRRFAIGRGADSVALSPVNEALILATAQQQLSSFDYTVREVPA